jgi:hypothetical protein
MLRFFGGVKMCHTWHMCQVLSSIGLGVECLQYADVMITAVRCWGNPKYMNNIYRYIQSSWPHFIEQQSGLSTLPILSTAVRECAGGGELRREK